MNLIEKGYLGEKQDLSKRSYFSHPTWKSYLKLKRNGHSIFHLSEIVKAVFQEVKNEKNVS